jgi:importin-7
MYVLDRFCNRYRNSNDIMSELVKSLFPSLVTIAQSSLQTFTSITSANAKSATPPPQLDPIATPTQETQTTLQQIQTQIPTILHLILKTYRTSVVLNLSQHQQHSDSLIPWGKVIFDVVRVDVPVWFPPKYGGMRSGDDFVASVQSGGWMDYDEEREESEWWKAKKWALGCLHRLFHRWVGRDFLSHSLLD